MSLMSKSGILPAELHSDRVEYSFCLRCKTINRIEVERRYGVLQEFHENGACLIRHPQWLVGRFMTFDDARSAMSEKLSELWRRSSNRRFWMGESMIEDPHREALMSPLEH